MESKIIKIVTIVSAVFFIGFLSLSLALPGHSYVIKNSILANPLSATKLITASISNLSDNEPQNILILGIPGKPNNAPDLTDTIIIVQIVQENSGASVNTISIPRDLLVENNGFWQRINSLYVNNKSVSRENGIKAVKSKVEEITGINITNYILIDITAVKELVNQVNGINVLIPQNIYDPNFPGPGSSYEPFEIKKGWRYLDGDIALRYARTRYGAEGDFGRIKRQLQIIRALKEKIFALNPVLDISKFLKILKTINTHIETDLSPIKIVSLWNTVKNINSGNSHHIIIDNSLEKKLLKGAQMILGNARASVLVPVEGIEKYEKIQKYIINSIK